MANPAAEDSSDTGGYLAPSFYFRIVFDGASAARDNSVPPDNSFFEVSGITPEIETQPVYEGGENRFIHQLPKAIKYPKLTLKRGIAAIDSPLVVWCKDVMEGGFINLIEPKDLTVRLLNHNGRPLRTWEIVNAYPVKWEVEGFNSTKNELAIEKVELNYNYAVRSDTEYDD